MTDTYPRQDGDTTVIGPECFSTADETVILWKGDNFYRACGMKVADLSDGGMTTCVKRTNHGGKRHEDYDGRIYHEIYGLNPDVLEMPIPTLWPAEIPVTKSGIKDAWNAFIKPTQEAGEPQSMELRIVMACLRTINDAMPPDEEIIAAHEPGLKPIEVDGEMIPTVVVDEVDGPCQACGGDNNEWRSENQDDKAVLVCTTCGHVRADR